MLKIKNTGYTTRMLESGFNWYEESHYFPVCFIANNMDIAIRFLREEFIRMAIDRGHTAYRHANKIILDAGATFYFGSEVNLQRLTRGMRFSDILFDNSCVGRWEQ